MRWHLNTLGGLGKKEQVHLTIGEKDPVDLAFAELASHLKEKMEGQEFADMNQVL
jgi:hypothetical protein